LDTVSKIIKLYYPKDTVLKETFPLYDDSINQYLDLSCVRQGQDVRYALNDNKLRALGWEPKLVFDEELPNIVEYYKNNFIW
jgi:dTDP-D-glucose 4,6-dehydratase